MDVTGEAVSGTFVSKEGATDGLMFDFNGEFTAEDGTVYESLVHFMKTEEGIMETFLDIQG